MSPHTPNNPAPSNPDALAILVGLAEVIETLADREHDLATAAGLHRVAEALRAGDLRGARERMLDLDETPVEVDLLRDTWIEVEIPCPVCAERTDADCLAGVVLPGCCGGVHLSGFGPEASAVSR